MVFGGGVTRIAVAIVTIVIMMIVVTQEELKKMGVNSIEFAVD